VGLPALGNEVDCDTCVTPDCETDPLSVMVESYGGGSITSIDVVSDDIIDVHLESEYYVGEDHERAGVGLKEAYRDGACGVYTNGFTYNSGPASEGSCDMIWGPPGGGSFSDGNPDAVHLVEGVYWLQQASASPGTFTCTVRLQRDAPA